MTASIPTFEPAKLQAGRTWKWTRDLADYPAGTWTLTYYFKKHDHSFSAVASATGTTHSVTVTAATTASIKPGIYTWKAIADAAGESFEVASGSLEVEIDFATSGNVDTRSHVRRTLEAIEATIEKRASSDQLAMAINGRSLQRTPVEELIKLRDRYRQEVKAEERAEKIKKGLAVNNSVRVRF